MHPVPAVADFPAVAGFPAVACNNACTESQTHGHNHMRFHIIIIEDNSNSIRIQNI
jgi:hypothetical protein